VAAYISMVCDQLRNSLPKAAVHCQVREAKRSLMDYFYTEVGKREVTILFTSSYLMSTFVFRTSHHELGKHTLTLTIWVTLSDMTSSC
jgi:hypothetical protein